MTSSPERPTSSALLVLSGAPITDRLLLHSDPMTFGDDLMKTYTVCGSMRFENEMKEIAWRLETEKGCNVLCCVYPPDGCVPTDEELSRLTAAHYRKIELSDGIYVVNIDGYVGSAVKKEIEYALSLGKEVIYHCN